MSMGKRLYIAVCLIAGLAVAAGNAAATGKATADDAAAKENAAREFRIESPDGRQSVRIEVEAVSGNGNASAVVTGNDGSKSPADDGTIRQTTRIWYSTFFDGKPVILKSAMDLTLDNGVWERAMGKFIPAREKWFDDLRLAGADTTARDTLWHNRYGERSTVRDAYNGIVLHFSKNDGSGYRLDIEARAYDEGIAFRYSLPTQDNSFYQRIKADNTEFTFPRGSLAWFTSWAQGPYALRPFEDWEAECERPMTVKINDSLYAAVGEAATVDFPRTKLKPGNARANTVVAALNDDGADIYTPYNMPWRVIMAEKSLGKLVENNDIFLNLNKASAIKDESWIKPGKIMRETRLNTENALAVIDFCAKHNMQYILFDAKWYGPEFDVRSDATKVREGLDLPEVIAYGKEKGIGVWLYVNQRALHRQADELFPLYEKWGVAGVKFGFVQFCNQHWASELHRLVRLAAKHHLLVNIHDEYRPTGWSRTYPNLLTQEGIRGNEEFPSADHNTVLPFTRMLCGAGDYTVCYFDKRLKTTHAHQLALPVVIFSPLQTLYWYDRPDIIKEVPELEFFDNVPTVWDDTKIIDDCIGKHIAIARRSGDEWFVGAIAGNEACRVGIPTSGFLCEGRKYIVRTYTDDDKAETPTKVRVGNYIVTGGDVMKFDFKAGGGAALHFIPADREKTKGIRRLGNKTVL